MAGWVRVRVRAGSARRPAVCRRGPRHSPAYTMWLLALLALTCARAEILSEVNDVLGTLFNNHRSIETMGGGCMYMGRWYAAGAAVRVRDACLRCRCAHGALSCARAACAPTPDPPPRRCALLHRRDACCPELHCPDGVRTLEMEAAARMEEESEVVTPAAPGHACAEEGGVFAAGSALAGRAACEQCFCLRGARRCVRPRCLPPPPGCAPRPAPGACCPARYYCDAHNLTTTTAPISTSTTTHNRHDCLVDGKWVSEGERVPATAAAECAACFCLRGGVRCQAPACAPALRGCTPLLRKGHCCPHQYHCPHSTIGSESLIQTISDNALISSKFDERSFRAASKHTTIAETSSSISTTGSSQATPPATIKVKRKTNDPPPKAVTHKPVQNATETTATTTRVTKEIPVTKYTTLLSTNEPTTTVKMGDEISITQPENSVRVIINGTVNCTAELSSARTDVTAGTDTTEPAEETPPGPQTEGDAAEREALSESDIITQRPMGTGFEDGESFTINVTSSLFGNKSHAPVPPPALLATPSASPTPPAAALPSPPAPASTTHQAEEANISKNAKEDYDYDYTEPTLPPSLPNLKIIPFVAADAVVDDEPPKDIPTYPVLEREDKFPVYYPSAEPPPPPPPLASRREDVYAPAQYPVFVDAGSRRPEASPSDKKSTIKHFSTSAVPDITVPTPSVNMFSPPVETEGGFVPKGPGIIDEYYAVYPRTPPPVPHLTTSMQINPELSDKVECRTSDGRVVGEGESVRVACSECACAWGELRCTPRACAAPPRCRRRPPAASSHDICCGELVCDTDNTTTAIPLLPIRRTEITLNVSKVPAEPAPAQTESALIPFDPPPDRSVPEPAPTAATDQTLNATTAKVEEITSPTPLNNQNYTTTKKPPQETTSSSTAMFTQTSTEKLLTSTATSVTTESADRKSSNATESVISQEYEDEEDDEGFSFGSVLKLLLSDSYDSTTTSTTKKKVTVTTAAPAMTSAMSSATASRPHSTTQRPPLQLTSGPFIPVPHHPPYIPPKKVLPQTSVNRIDHLVLGEATAIKKTTVYPWSTTHRPPATPVRRFTLKTTTRKPTTTTRPTVPSTEEPQTQHTSVPSMEAMRPAAANFGGVGGGGAGLLKLAGCNIYGRMYRVGRIIAELSTPCQECRCTELGVQCAPLRC